MVGARSGKHSLKQISGRPYVGASASQKVRAAEWTGQFPTSSRGAPWVNNVDYDYNKPWFERRDEDYYCLLCRAYATEGHVTSDRHLQRESFPSYYGFPGGEEDTRFNHPWFEKIGGEWHCHLCDVVATEGHITSERHVRRQQYPESYGYTSQKKPEGDPSVTRVDEGSSTSRGMQWVTNIDYDKPWFERRDGDYYCLLCWAYATEGHVMSNRHVQRESCPSYYGFQSGKQDTQFDHPWYEKVSGEWFCHLCDARATEEHLNSERHVRRQLCPERYGYSSDRRPDTNTDRSTEWRREVPGGTGTIQQFPEQTHVPSAQGALPRVAYTRLPAPDLPEPWCSYWSEAYQRYYYHNEDSGATTWQQPCGIPVGTYDC